MKSSVGQGKMSVDEPITSFNGKFIVAVNAGTNKIIWLEMDIYTLPGFEPGKEYQVKVSENCWVEWP